MAAAPGSRPWRRAALLASIAAQLITLAAIEGADPAPATWTALLLAVAPAPLALIAAFAPPRPPAGREDGDPRHVPAQRQVLQREPAAQQPRTCQTIRARHDSDHPGARPW